MVLTSQGVTHNSLVFKSAVLVFFDASFGLYADFTLPGQASVVIAKHIVVAIVNYFNILIIQTKTVLPVLTAVVNSLCLQTVIVGKSIVHCHTVALPLALHMVSPHLEVAREYCRALISLQRFRLLYLICQAIPFSLNVVGTQSVIVVRARDHQPETLIKKSVAIH